MTTSSSDCKYRHSPETRKKISATRTGKRVGPRTDRIQNPWPEPNEREYQQSVDHRAKIGARNRGSNSGTAVLNEQKVAEVKRLLSEKALTQEEIGIRFGVSGSLIGMIQRNCRWAHVPWPVELDTTH